MLITYYVWCRDGNFSRWDEIPSRLGWDWDIYFHPKLKWDGIRIKIIPAFIYETGGGPIIKSRHVLYIPLIL